jgi:hypothetical protein
MGPFKGVLSHNHFNNFSQLSTVQQRLGRQSLLINFHNTSFKKVDKTLEEAKQLVDSASL